MQAPYRPKLGFSAGMTPEQRQDLQAASNARYDAAGITQEIADTVLPSGGKGFQWAFYRHGERIPNGIQGLADK